MKTFSRMLQAALLLVAPLVAGPPLTTIQDVLYKADGSRFNGTVTISWNSFEASDTSAIATQVTSVKVIDGNLRVQLVPNTNANPPVYYTVAYNSDGRVQFTETWAVPTSAMPLRIRDVRIAAPPSGSTGNDTAANGPMQESDIAGLTADLNARPVKGPGYAAGRVALVNASGALESVIGNFGDCVRVDGSSGPCGQPAPAFMDSEVPSGLVDGSNTQFSLLATPSPVSSIAVYRNGILLSLGTDYTVSSRTIQFVAGNAPTPGDTLLASYRLSTTSSGAPQAFPGPQVLCSGTGNSVSSTSFSSMGICSIPAGTLANGDRVEIRFDVEHQGSNSSFSIEVHWGGTTVLHRDAAAGDVQVTGQAGAGLYPSGAKISTQSWGTVLPFSATVSSAADVYTNPLTIDFQGKMSAGAESVALRNYAVVRVP